MLDYIAPFVVVVLVAASLFAGLKTGVQMCRSNVGEDFKPIARSGFCYLALCYTTKYNEQVCFAPPIKDVANYSKGKSLCYMLRNSCMYKEEEGFGDYKCNWSNKDNTCYCWVNSPQE